MTPKDREELTRRGRPTGLVYVRLLVSLLLAVTVLAACTDAGSDTDNPADDSMASADNDDTEVLNVVVTMPFLPSMVAAVGDDLVEVESIVPQGADAHTYQPSPGDAQMISDADIIFANGLGLDAFLEDLIDSAGGTSVPVVELAEDLHDVAIEDDEHEEDDHAHEGDHEEDEADHDHDHDHEAGNPHLWLDPIYGVEYVEHIADTLIEADPDNESEYRSNADDYIAEIEEFDQWATEQLEAIPEENRRMVTFHDAFPYFADHYGLEITGVVIRSPGREPGAREIAELADEISELGVPAVFIEPQFNPDLAESIASEANVSIHTLYSDTPPEDAGYLEMMRSNVESVVEGLG